MSDTTTVPTVTVTPAEATTGYEGAQSSSIRTAFIAFPTNSRRELNSYTRTQFVRKVRALDANLPIVGRISRKIAQHSVGKGIFARPITTDSEWNTLNRKRFEERMQNPWLYSTDASRDLYEDQRLCVEGIVGDGESLSLLTRKNGIRMVQPLDPFECASPLGFDPRVDSLAGWRPHRRVRCADGLRHPRDATARRRDSDRLLRPGRPPGPQSRQPIASSTCSAGGAQSRPAASPGSTAGRK
jgi:hypothetical protein